MSKKGGKLQLKVKRKSIFEESENRNTYEGGSSSDDSDRDEVPEKKVDGKAFYGNVFSENQQIPNNAEAMPFLEQPPALFPSIDGEDRFTGSHTRSSSLDMDFYSSGNNSSSIEDGSQKKSKKYLTRTKTPNGTQNNGNSNKRMNSRGSLSANGNSSNSNSPNPNSTGIMSQTLNNGNNSSKTGNMGNSSQSQDPWAPVIDEVPLLEELGIDFSEVFQKTLFVLFPFFRGSNNIISRWNKKIRSAFDSIWRIVTFKKKSNISGFGPSSPSDMSNSEEKEIDVNVFLDDSDMIGPILISLLLGVFLVFLRGKLQFGYILGYFGVCCVFIFVLLNLMYGGGSPQISQQMQQQNQQIPQPKSYVELYGVISVLGYSLMPIVVLSLGVTMLDLFLKKPLQYNIWFFSSLAVCILCVVWATYSATSMFVSALKMHHHFLIIAYPIALVYTTFAFLAIF